MSEQQRNAAADREACEEAAPGPWRVVKDRDGDITILDSLGRSVVYLAGTDRDADASSIAEAREALPWWIAEAERLRAEPTPLARLEAWANRHDAWPKLCLFWVQLEHPNRTPPDVVAYRCPSEERDYHAKEMGTATVAAGTDEQPATLDEMILAALAKWEELYGDK